MRIILFAIVMALFALALAPAMALGAQGELEASHCSSETPVEQPASGNCFLHCQLIQCRLSSAGDARIVNLTASGSHEFAVRFNLLARVAVSADESAFLPPEPAAVATSRCGVTYQCRNSLGSDDPASL